MNWQEQLRTEGYTIFRGLIPPSLVSAALAAIAIDLHTVLVGVFLTPVRRDFAGNFTVWPQSHYLYESYFRERGPQALIEPTPKPPVGDPVQLKCEPGDVVLAHYHVGHAAAVNTSDTNRVAVYFRVWLRSPKSEQWKYLTHIWEGWRI